MFEHAKTCESIQMLVFGPGGVERSLGMCRFCFGREEKMKSSCEMAAYQFFRFLPGMRSPSRSSVQNSCVCIGNDCLGFFFLHEYLGVFSTHRKSLEILESVARFNLGSDFERYIYCSWLFLKSSPNLFRSST